jgi:membrane associated rhomboid family serine protease
MNLIEDFKWQFRKGDNALIKIILINVFVFVTVHVIYVFCYMSNKTDFYFTYIYSQFELPSSIIKFLHKPWTIITYFFAHYHLDIFHIIFNMLGLYWFGTVVKEFVGSKKLISLYVLGGLSAGIFYLFIFNVLVKIANIPPSVTVIGASGAVMSVVVGAATLVPSYNFFLPFIGAIRIIYIAGIYIFISFIGIVGSNSGGDVAHLGGALMGYVYAKQLRNGTDLGKWIIYLLEDFPASFKRKSRLKVSYKNTGSAVKNSSTTPDQKEIDDILDKISRSGYESLTKEEKQKLFKASQK